VRELGVYCEIHLDMSDAEVRAFRRAA